MRFVRPLVCDSALSNEDWCRTGAVSWVVPVIERRRYVVFVNASVSVAFQRRFVHVGGALAVVMQADLVGVNDTECQAPAFWKQIVLHKLPEQTIPERSGARIQPAIIPG
jgi:hypothetical protein